MAATGAFDANLFSAIGRFIRPGFKVLNFGAQFGTEGIAMAKIIGESG